MFAFNRNNLKKIDPMLTDMVILMTGKEMEHEDVFSNHFSDDDYCYSVDYCQYSECERN